MQISQVSLAVLEILPRGASESIELLWRLIRAGRRGTRAFLWPFCALELNLGEWKEGGEVAVCEHLSLAIGFISNIIALGIGLPYGAAAAWYGGAVDFVLIRIIEIINSVPNLLLGILGLIRLTSQISLIAEGVAV